MLKCNGATSKYQNIKWNHLGYCWPTSPCDDDISPMAIFLSPLRALLYIAEDTLRYTAHCTTL